MLPAGQERFLRMSGPLGVCVRRFRPSEGPACRVRRIIWVIHRGALPLRETRSQRARLNNNHAGDHVGWRWGEFVSLKGQSATPARL